MEKLKITQVDEDSTWNVLAGAGFHEESRERIIVSADNLVRWHLSDRNKTFFLLRNLPENKR